MPCIGIPVLRTISTRNIDVLAKFVQKKKKKKNIERYSRNIYPRDHPKVAKLANVTANVLAPIVRVRPRRLFDGECMCREQYSSTFLLRTLNHGGSSRTNRERLRNVSLVHCTFDVSDRCANVLRTSVLASKPAVGGN